MERLDLTTQRIGMLTVMSRNTDERISKLIFWNCLCDCGKTTIVPTCHLRDGHTRSCGCLKKADRYKDYTGFKYNMLTVISFYGKSKRKRTLWNCRCDCGNMKVVNSSNFISGAVKSCGCLSLIPNNLKHGQSKNRISETLDNMKGRCYRVNNGSYKDYGGRGITICDEWLKDTNTFYEWAFNNGYTNNLTIERIDSNGNYEPNNCTWIKKEAQSSNRRNTLGNDTVKKIRDEIKNGYSNRALATKYNVCISTIYYIKVGKNYNL